MRRVGLIYDVADLNLLVLRDISKALSFLNQQEYSEEEILDYWYQKQFRLQGKVLLPYKPTIRFGSIVPNDIDWLVDTCVHPALGRILWRLVLIPSEIGGRELTKYSITERTLTLEYLVNADIKLSSMFYKTNT
ncbi:MAG: hypothetical protein IBX57_00090 [Gammaproteobacteria bacterium]|nr:hypothetical protein [Gammaproteobacteria bacterium]